MKIKTITHLCQEIAKRECGKKEVNIAQLREITGILSDIIFEQSIHSSDVEMLLFKNGKRRFIRRMKPKAKK